MFCLQCEKPKAEAGCYLPDKFERICLSCYRSIANCLPLPASAGSALGGKLADTAKLGVAIEKQALKSTSGVLSDLSKAVVSGLSTGLNVAVAATKEVIEAESAAQCGVMGLAKNLAATLNDTVVDTAQDGAKAIVGVAHDGAKAVLNNVFQQIKSYAS